MSADTPRTDKEVCSEDTIAERNHYAPGWVEADFARTLERELAEAKAHHQRDEALIVQRTNEIRALEADKEAIRAESLKALAENVTLRAEVEAQKNAVQRNWNRYEREESEHAKCRARVAELIDAAELLLAGYEGLDGDMENNGPKQMRQAIDAARTP
jgi:hypothetical protein